MTIIELAMKSMAHGGSALGRHDGRVVFVPFTIPGERITANITDERGRVIFAEGVQLLDASADRVRPACAHFGPRRCNGCQWQHIAYPAQLLLKQDVVADQLERLGGFPDADVRAVVASTSEWGYADQFMLSVGRDGQLGMPSSGGGSTAPKRVRVDASRLIRALNGRAGLGRCDRSGKACVCNRGATARRCCC